MSGNKSKSRPTEPLEVTRSWSARDTTTLVIALIVCIGVGYGISKAFERDPDEPTKTMTPVTRTAEPNAPTTASVTSSQPSVTGYRTLIGKWMRADGGYVLDVKAIDATGKMDAAYLNPNPIRVAKAEASQNEGRLRIFVELRDVNYPGSTYDLIYEAQGNRLVGEYFQAAQQQRFPVVFERLP